jgi:hypothetical protein
MDKNIQLKSKWSLKKPLYLKKTDRRYAIQIKQLKKWGFSDSETWSLYDPIAEFILPRLIRFKEITIAYPGNNITMEKWKAMLDEMIFAFDWALHDEDDKYDNLTEKQRDANWKRYEKGMELFAKWFRALWW